MPNAKDRNVSRQENPGALPAVGQASPPSSDDEQDASGRRSLRPLLALKPYLLRHPGPLVGAGIALIVSALAMLAVPMAVRRIIDHGFGAQDSAMIDQYFMMMIVIGAVLAVASASRFFLVNWIGERVVADLRSDVFAHLARLGPDFYDRTHSGEVMSRLTADTTQIKAVAGSAISQALRNTIMLIGAFVMMLITSPGLSLLVLIAIPIIVLPLIGYGRTVRRLSRTAQDTLAEASAYAAENLAAVRTMQAFGHEEAVSRRFATACERAFSAAKSRLFARAGLTGLVILLVVSSIVGVLWYGSAAVVSGEMTAGRLSQFVIYALLAASALGELSEVWGETTQAAGAAERITEFLTIAPEIKSPANPVPLPRPVKGEIEFRAVRFGYVSRPDTPALEGVSFRVAPGERIALVGPSGAGKSTILNLILRFYDPTGGHVLIDGVDISTVALDELRGVTALVPQEVALFADTVAENIRYGTPGASEADVIRAAVAAQADGFIRALPNGYDTRLGERGVSLSGGQRQRIAIARAILKDAPILLLDEATSALDTENEIAVQRALETLTKGRTTIVVAHRLSTVQNADRILVLDKGRIVESGRHAELAKQSGLYARLSELQFGSEAAE
ncbi:ABC transporter transmembrane domain-containing protein [Hyphomicrobium sp. CS1GBMeth3]|uniref:ABC transporter transmembrane domain-containing protein n=1 Tax=Hyphomicrobium sp. CS1GBMeth3 TaxID=1892845 RepID=UPI00092FF0BF|nr:ABC transporter transmembrane domain-containing protein [Hyphomicrobium sp. CS1GBMeth3]